jgi:protein TonB
MDVTVPFALDGALDNTVRPVMSGKIRAGSTIMALKLVYRVLPAYPEQARQDQIAGTVKLDITVGEDGSVESVTVLEGHTVLAAAAGAAVREWKYQPTQSTDNR